MRLYHGGIAGLSVGDHLQPSPPHVTDGCPVCVARAEGRSITVGEYRHWLRGLGARALPVLKQLGDAPDDAPLDPPSAVDAVYVTSSIPYATWYAARSAGDLYRIVPEGPIVRSVEDNFDTYLVPRARIVEVVRRRVRLTRRERRELDRLWRKADRRHEVSNA